MSKLKKRYLNSIKEELQNKFGFSNPNVNAKSFKKWLLIWV